MKKLSREKKLTGTIIMREIMGEDQKGNYQSNVFNNEQLYWYFPEIIYPAEWKKRYWSVKSMETAETATTKWRKIMRRVIAISNQKGGVGKPPQPWILNWTLPDRERKCCLIDADPQESDSKSWLCRTGWNRNYTTSNYDGYYQWKEFEITDYGILHHKENVDPLRKILNYLHTEVNGKRDE